MFANERQNKIYELLQSSGAVSTSGLVADFSVSVETIRRDFLAMEKAGRLTRVHGGAIAKSGMKTFMDLQARNKEFEAEKKELSFKAMDFIKEGDIIGVDSGSTAVAFAAALKARFSALTVVTHSIDVFEVLRDYKSFTLILCGGHYLSEENAFYGELPLDMLRGLHLQKAFIFPSAVSFEYGIYDYQKELHQVQKQLISSSDRIYILADSSKFEKTGLLKLADMNPEYHYITDSALADGVVKLYEENQIKIYRGQA